MSFAHLQIEDLGFRYDSASEPVFDDFNLSLGPGWTGLVGPNGSGKSTLLERAVSGLKLPADRFVYLAQEITAGQSARMLKEVRALGRRDKGEVMKTVGSLGSDPRRLLESGQLSPGEARKLLLALGAVRDPWLIVMDEPTNHLDLPSIECLEAALKEVRCGLLLVSHDARFLEATAGSYWRIAAEDGGRVMRLKANRS